MSADETWQRSGLGEQATALLSILLLEDGPPLLIDQPEDDLNMKVINDIVETLWQAKTHRQVIFSSHNANLVVNGDAEIIICCDYRTSGAGQRHQWQICSSAACGVLHLEFWGAASRARLRLGPGAPRIESSSCGPSCWSGRSATKEPDSKQQQ